MPGMKTSGRIRSTFCVEQLSRTRWLPSRRKGTPEGRETAILHADLRERQRELLLAVAAGDEAALSDLYDLFEGPLFSLGIRWLGERGLAEELVQR